jgi:hypothetical protein
MPARVALSGDVITYLVSEASDARSAASISAAEQLGHKQSWAYLDVARPINGCQNAHPGLTGLSLGTRERRHIDSRHQLVESIVVTGVWPRTPSRSRIGRDDPKPIPTARRHGVRDTARRAHKSRHPNRFAAGRAADGNQYAGASLRVVETAFANRPCLWRCILPSCQSLALRSGL